MAEQDELAERLKYEQQRSAGMGGTEYDLGRAIEAATIRHPDPETTLFVLRDLQLGEETFRTNGELSNQWEVVRRAEILHDRALTLAMPLEDLERRGIVEPLTPTELEEVRAARGGLIPTALNENFFAKSKYVDGYAIINYNLPTDVIESYERGADGKPINVRYRTGLEKYGYFGTPEQRKEFSKSFLDTRDEVLVRHLVMQHWGHYVTYYYALNKLAEGFYFNPTISNEGLGRIFNLKSQEGAANETITGVELRSLGDKIDIAMRLYYVAALCEKPERFRELMDSPGYKEFLFPPGTPQGVVEEWIGKPNKWEADVEAGGNRSKDTTHKERMANIRGRLTQKNIFAETNLPIEEKLNLAVQEFIGGGGGDDVSHVNKIEAETARRIAYRLFRVLLLADKEGYELLKETPKGDKMDPFDGLKIVFENAPTASDFGKLTHPDLYMAKSHRKNRDYSTPVGYLNSRENYSRLMVDFLRHTVVPTQVDIQIGQQAPTRIVEKRSLMERWWGYNQADIRGDNGQEVAYLIENALRLGDVPWETLAVEDVSERDAIELELPIGGLHNEVLKSLWLSGFMAGGEGRVHGIISETNFNPSELMDVGWWLKFWKGLDVGIKSGIALDGKMRGVGEDVEKAAIGEFKVKIVRNFIRGLQSTNQWQEWVVKEIDIQDEMTTEKHPSIAQRILQTAKKALEEAGIKDAKLESWIDLKKRVL